MTVDVVYSQYDDAYRNELPLRDCHRPLGSFVWLDWLRDRTGNDRLFCYHHDELGSNVLAAWVFSPEEAAVPVAMELETLCAHPSSWWPFDLSPPVMLARLRPVNEQRARWAAKRKARAAELRAAKADTHTQRKEAVAWHRKRGQKVHAERLLKGAVPFVGAREAALAGEMDRA